jgi:trehalose 6-phosphate phosphatase
VVAAPRVGPRTAADHEEELLAGSAETLQLDELLPAGTSATRWCLFLDVDGTLLDIASTPDAVEVDETLKALLLRTQRALEGAVALVSGRSIAALDQLFAPQRWPAAGLHGLERRDAAGSLHLVEVPRDTAFDAARSALEAVAQATPGVLLEDKVRSLALHYRAVPEREPELRRLIHAIADGLGDSYSVLEGKRVLELKPAGVTKADAIRAFLAEPPFVARRPIFVGDDVTDLDGFTAVEHAGGLSVAVGDRVRAQTRVASPREVRALLADLADGRPVEP